MLPVRARNAAKQQGFGAAPTKYKRDTILGSGNRLEPAFQLKISLKGIRPPIWRRVVVPGYATLGKLHEIIQAAMGWEDYHLHEFIAAGTSFASKDADEFLPSKNERSYRLWDVVGEPKDRLRYVYDFGDYWEHDIVVEKVLPIDEVGRRATCIKGKRACPPEDVGGVYGYEHYLEAIQDPDHPEHGELREWRGDFDPEAFDLEAANAAVQSISISRPRKPKQRPPSGPDSKAPATLPPGSAAGGIRPTEALLRQLARAVEGRGLDSVDDINAFLKEAMEQGTFDDDAVDSPEDRAFDLIEQAYAATSSSQRVALAREALAAWPGCLDAYVLLAAEEEELAEAIRILEEGVRTGEQLLGKELFEEDAGHFWGLIETRPYMRVRKSLADALVAIGRVPEAIAHAEELLRLNEHDNMGVRYDLLNWYLAAGQPQGVTDLLERFGEDNEDTLWIFPQALYHFQREGDSSRARWTLQQALAANPHMPDALFDTLNKDVQVPEMYTVGSYEEALICVSQVLISWPKVDGALPWLSEQLRAFVDPSPRRVNPSVGRNDPCPCGSGKKYKRCCLG